MLFKLLVFKPWKENGQLINEFAILRNLLFCSSYQQIPKVISLHITADFPNDSQNNPRTTFLLFLAMVHPWTVA